MGNSKKTEEKDAVASAVNAIVMPPGSMQKAARKIERFAWEMVNEDITRSRFWEKTRNEIAQVMINEALPLIPKNKQEQFVNSLGYYRQSEFARLKGYSRQYAHKICANYPDKVFWNGTWYMKVA